MYSEQLDTKVTLIVHLVVMGQHLIDPALEGRVHLNRIGGIIVEPPFSQIEEVVHNCLCSFVFAILGESVQGPRLNVDTMFVTCLTPFIRYRYDKLPFRYLMSDLEFVVGDAAFKKVCLPVFL